ncbi:MAG: retropepsin-like aspartic protease [Anaerolineales bacterium]
MNLYLQDDLPFVTIILIHKGRQLEIPDVLIDTGSGGTIFAADYVAKIGIVPQREDTLRYIHGIGGSEVVFLRKVEFIQVGNYIHQDFEIEIGGMDYGFKIGGILGMDFLLSSRAKINLEQLSIEFMLGNI